jgi:cell division transport system permease protein
VRLGLVLGEVATGLKRNVSMVISVILVTFISLTFVGAAILLQFQITQMKGYWYDKAQVTVSFCLPFDKAANCSGSEASQEQIDAVEATLTSDTLQPYIESYAFESHDDAYKNFQAQFGDTTLGEFTTPEGLPQSFRINLVDPDDSNQSALIAEALSNAPGVFSVDDQRKYLDQIFAVLNTASFAAVGLAGLMLIAAVLLIATTIRLSAFSRRRELGIMRLVGASNRFIQTPFILEGVFAAVIGSLLAGGAIVAIVQFFVRGFVSDALGPASTIALIGLDDALVVVPVLVVIGGVLAAASAGFAINRYLKV